jgi:hypothetical protein
MGLFQILTDPGTFKFYVNGNSNTTFGDSNQPYVITPPPDEVKFLTPIKYEKSTKKLVGGLFSGFTTTGTQSNLFPYLGSVFASLPNQIRYNPKSWGPDFLNRGNLFGYLRAADDVERLTKYFFDFKSFSGPLFIIKQNLLSTIGVKTESSRGAAYGGGIINEGIYSPTSTIAQAGVGFLGVFLNKQGIDPTGLIPQLKINTYQDSIYSRQFRAATPTVLQYENRLIALSNKTAKVYEPGLKENLFVGYTLLPNADVLLKYDGGPGSVYGIGNTKINFATDNIGKNPLKTLANFKDLLNLFNFDNFSTPLTWTRLDFNSQQSNESFETLQDFREKLFIDTPKEVIKKRNITTFLSSTSYYNLLSQRKTTDGSSFESYTTNIEKRVNLGNPSKRGNRSNPLKGKTEFTTNKLIGPQDFINASPIYPDIRPDFNDPFLKDLIDFNIGVYDNSKIGNQELLPLNYMHFRVFLNDFSDSYNGEWKALDYVGRGENFYKYSGFKRDISISFIVAASTKEELMPIYNKLNYLASSVAPYYSPQGYMSGNFHQITLGNWLNQQPGFISQVDLSIPEESPWEINLEKDDPSTKSQFVQQLPHMVEVKIKFTPIHRFRPSIQINPTSKSPGPQRYFGFNQFGTPPSNIPSQTNANQNLLNNGSGLGGLEQSIDFFENNAIDLSPAPTEQLKDTNWTKTFGLDAV